MYTHSTHDGERFPVSDEYNTSWFKKTCLFTGKKKKKPFMALRLKPGFVTCASNT